MLDDPEIHNDRGTALAARGALAEAEREFREAIRRRPAYAEAHNNLGNVLADLGRPAEAVAAFHEALRLRPDYPHAHYNLAITLRDHGQVSEAVTHYEAALRLRPDHPEAHNNLAIAHRDLGEFAAAVRHYREAIRLRPDYPEARNNLGVALKELGRFPEARAEYREALRLNPAFAQPYSNILFCMNHDPDCSPEQIHEEHCRWAAVHGTAPVAPHANDPSPQRPLRVGYVSPDLCEHPVARLMGPVLAAHDHRRFEVFCYADVSRPDAMSRRLQERAGHWRQTVGWSDERLIEQIRADQIDILVDLVGHTGGNRLLAFAHKPAPVQVALFGYPNTTGLRTMDYRITDSAADPPGRTERYWTEQLVRLPDIAWCYQPRWGAEAEEPSDPGPGDDVRSFAAPVTLGSLNRRSKINAAVVALWSRILAQPGLTDARLLLLSPGDAESQDALREMFTRQGIAAERVHLVGRTTRADYLQLWRQIDIGLDPFPYTGGVTTCDALWMGVPVVTLAGGTYASRQGVSILSAVGLHEWIAQAPDEYVEIVTRWARDLPRLRELRRGLRDRMERSPVMDGRRYTGHLETAYRQMWERWCRTGS